MSRKSSSAPWANVASVPYASVACPCVACAPCACLACTPCTSVASDPCTSVACVPNICATCGARTRACRVHTRVNAILPSSIRTRPRIILDPLNQSSLNRIPLNIPSNLAPLAIISHPMIVGLPLPELFTRATEQPVCLTRRHALQRLQQQARRNQRQQKQVNVIRHNHPRSELIVVQSHTTKQRFDDHRGNCLVPKVNGTRLRSVEVAVHPDKSFALRYFASRRKMRARQAAIKMPSKEQPAVVGIYVRKPALGPHALISGRMVVRISRSHECERGTHECVRHKYKGRYD